MSTDRPGNQGPLISLAAGTTAAGNGLTLDGDAIFAESTLQLTVTGTPSGGTVQLQGSLDDLNWTVLGSVSPTSSGVASLASSVPCRYLRAVVTSAVTGGASIEATVAFTTSAQAVASQTPQRRLYWSAGVNGVQQIFASNPDGSSPVQLTNDPLNHCWRPIVSPGGDRVLFLKTPYSIAGTNFSNSANAYSWSIWTMNADGSNPNQIVAAPGGTNALVTPDWNPAGGIIYVLNGIATVAQDDGSGATSLTITGPPSGLVSDTAVSPDGLQIAFQDATNHNIWVCPIQGGAATQLTSDGLHHYDPRWAPDMSQVFFETQLTTSGGPVGTGTFALQGIVPTDTSGNTQATYGPTTGLFTNPRPSDDGWLYCYAWPTGGTCWNLYKVRIADGAVQQLTSYTNNQLNQVGPPMYYCNTLLPSRVLRGNVPASAVSVASGTETTLINRAYPQSAQAFKAAQQWKIDIWGFLSSSSSPLSLQLAVYVGPNGNNTDQQVVALTFTPTASKSNVALHALGHFITHAIGAAGTAKCQGDLIAFSSQAIASPFYADAVGSTVSTGFSTQQTNFITVTAKWNSYTSGDSLALTASIEPVNAP